MAEVVPEPTSDGSRSPTPMGGGAPAGGSRLSGPIDPYRDWLGIETQERPPSYYALLGLPELESDVESVTESAKEVKRRLRAYQIGQYRKQALAVLTEVGRAVETLASENKKQAYDAERLRILLERAEAVFPQADLKRSLDEMFSDWLAQCNRMKLPVPEMIPDLMRWCLQRNLSWPAQGTSQAPLPLGLWVYCEVAIVGQSLTAQPLEQRARAVKLVQQSFGISEQLSRIINLDVARRPQSFGRSPLVQLAAERPREVLQQWVDRLAGRGIVLRNEDRLMSALAFLLGLVEKDGQPLAEPITPQAQAADEETVAIVPRTSRRSSLGRVRRQSSLGIAFRTALVLAIIFTILLILLLAAL